MSTLKLITLETNGKAVTLFDDELPDLGSRTVVRASTVEPSKDGEAWIVQLSDNPLNGTFAKRTLGWYETKRKATDDEVEFLQRRIRKGVLDAEKTR